MPIFWTALKIVYIICSTIVFYRVSTVENKKEYSNRQNQVSISMFLAMTNFIAALVLAALLIGDFAGI